MLVRLILSDAEYDALAKLAQSKLRDPRAQALHIIRKDWLICACCQEPQISISSGRE